ncbi:MAG: hypothetical protein ACI8S6_001710 [Myxococcota bacterium]|jgi:hypothetical protein
MTIALLLITALHAEDPTPTATATATQRVGDHERWPIGMDCPSHAPIKGNLTPHSDEYCIYHVPSGEYYRQTRPERCFVTEEAALAAGCR